MPSNSPPRPGDEPRRPPSPPDSSGTCHVQQFVSEAPPREGPPSSSCRCEISDLASHRGKNDAAAAAAATCASPCADAAIAASTCAALGVEYNVAKAPPYSNAGTTHNSNNNNPVVGGGGGTSSSTVAGATETTADEGTFTTATGTLSKDGHHHHAGGVTPLALKGFHDAMELVDPSRKTGYVRAQRECPEVVLERECCPCYFLVAAKNDPWEASARMCNYWNERIQLFGEHGAFQALTLGSEAGAGAPPTGLTDDDVAVFQSGYIQVLPPDHMGRSVLSYDEGRLDATMAEHTASRLKVLWYVAQAAYTSGEALAHRVVILISGQRSFTRPTTLRLSLASRKLPSVLPIVVDAIHLLSLSSRFGSGRAVLQDLWAATLDMAGNYLSNFFTMHHGTAGRKVKDPQECEDEARADLMRKLRAQGFARTGTPDWAGGKFTMEDFRRWMRQRRRLECRTLWTEDQREQHKRNINRFHSRKKRQRRQHELQALQDEVDQLRAANTQARIVGQTLETLLVECSEMIQHAFQGNRTRWDEPLPTISTGMAEKYFQNCPAIPEDDEFPPGVLASLEPDPIAPHCLPIATERQEQTPFAFPELGLPAFSPGPSVDARCAIHEFPRGLAATATSAPLNFLLLGAVSSVEDATAAFEPLPIVSSLHPAGCPRHCYAPQDPLSFPPSGLGGVERQSPNPGGHPAGEGSTVETYWSTPPPT